MTALPINPKSLVTIKAKEAAIAAATHKARSTNINSNAMKKPHG
jgi:hypothetical protein